MIRLIELEDPRQREDFLSKIKGGKDCFLVSDIKSKWAAERQIIQQNGLISGQPILRMRDFLKELFLHTHPHWQIVSKSFLEKYFLEFAGQHTSPWVNNIQNSGDFFLYLNQFLPVISHPESSRLMEEWLDEKNQSIRKRWQRWYHLSVEFFHFIQKKKWIHEEGMKGLLLNELPNFTNPFPWPEGVTADLGIHFDSCEQEILKLLSSFTEITILTPKLKTDILTSLPPYHRLKKTIPPSDKMVQRKKERNSTNFFKEEYISTLEEVKGTTAQVRAWINQGIKEDDIAVMAQNIEEYWFCLQTYLERENIRVQKSLTARATDFPEIMFWMASLKVHIGWMDFPLLESRAFYKNPQISFTQFQSQFFQNPERDLSKQNFCRRNQIRDPEQKVSGREFIEWALSLWPKEETDNLFNTVLATFQDVPLEARLQWKRWVMFLETRLHHQEEEIEKESGEGISCLSLNAIDSVKASHVIVMGLDEESLRNYEESSLNQKDWECLDRELGFPLPFGQGPEKEMALQWFFQSSRLKEVILSFSSTDFFEQARTPSVFFLMFDSLRPLLKKQVFHRKNPTTAWDSLKKQKTVSEILYSRMSPTSLQNVEQTLREDREGLCHPFASNSISSFSPSSLNEYASCGFVYAARHIFQIKKRPTVDWEVSPLDIGALQHRFLEKLLFELSSLKLNEEQMEELIKELEIEETVLMNEKQKILLMRALKSLGKKFLEKEKEWRNRYPHLKPLAGEKWIQCFWNEKTNQLDSKGNMMFKGRMDRVDFDSENLAYVLLDYKRNLNQNIVHMTNWLNKSDFQLSLYAQALEKGLAEGLKPALVEAAAYYGLRGFDYKGYVNKNSPYKEIFGNRSRARKTRKDFEKNQKELNETIRHLLVDIKRGIFFPKPKDPSDCKTCDWRKWCRATHLN